MAHARTGCVTIPSCMTHARTGCGTIRTHASCTHTRMVPDAIPSAHHTVRAGGRSHARAYSAISAMAIACVSVLARPQAERGHVDGAEVEEEGEEEDGAGDEVEDAVPDHLARRRDDVRALGARPADRVEHEQEREGGGGADVAAAYGTTCCEGRASAMAEQDGPVDGVSCWDRNQLVR